MLTCIKIISIIISIIISKIISITKPLYARQERGCPVMKDKKKYSLKSRIISALAALSVTASSFLSPINVYSEDGLDASAFYGDTMPEDGAQSDKDGISAEIDPADDPAAQVFEETDIEAEITTSAYVGSDASNANRDCTDESGGTLTAFAENEYKITLDYGASAGIPADAQLEVKEVPADDYLADAADALGLNGDDCILYSRFFDIAIVKDGAEIEPLTPVTVSAELFDAEESADILKVVHFDEDGASEIENCTKSDDEIRFETQSFSVYGFGSVLHTVFSETSDIADITLYSTDDSVRFADTPAFIEAPEEGIEPSKSFMLEKDGAADDTKLWVKADMGKKADLAEGENYALYSVCDGAADKAIIDNIASGGALCAVGNESEGVVLMKDTGFRRLNFEFEQKGGSSVALDGLMPKGALAEAVDVTAGRNENTIAAYDITILNGGKEYQPSEERPVYVTVTDPKISEDADLQLWHIKDGGEREEITDFTVCGNTLGFEAIGFSVYEIVQGPEAFTPVLSTAQSLDDIRPENGKDKAFYISASKGEQNANYYFKNAINYQAKNGAVFNTTAKNVIQDGSVWYFETVSANDNTYRVYTYLSASPNEKKYILRNTSGTGNAIDLTADPAQAVVFEMSLRSQGLFYMKDSNAVKYFQFSNGGGGARFYDSTGDKNDNNSRLTLTDADSLVVPDDYYGLNGKTYGLMYAASSGGISLGQGMTAAAAGDATKLSAEELVVRTNGYDHKSELYVDLTNSSELAMFTFHSVSSDKYLLSANINDTIKYLNIGSAGISFVDIDNASEIQVIPGTGANSGKLMLCAGGVNIKYSNRTFMADANSYTWLSLVKPSLYQDDDFVIYSAEKTSISNPAVTTGTEIIVYIRIWNTEESRYDFYAVDHDGSLVPCFERGNSIMWVGSKINTLLWEFTEYTYADGTPNYYYELYNPYSGKYLAPQLTSVTGTSGQVLSDSTIGLNLPGRRSGSYYTQITAWDTPYYTYASLKADGTDRLVSCARFDSDTATFYFATMEHLAAQSLTEIETVDNNDYGITMKMIDFEGELVTVSGTKSTKKQSDVIGESVYTGSAEARYGLLKTNLTAGYPTAKMTGRSLSELFADAEEVNHLFIESTRKASGYFEYDSCQNFASLKGRKSGDFTVYRELGSIEGSKVTYMHGQFLPYNDIDPNLLITNENANPKNLYDAEQNPLSENDPRKYEQLYKVSDPEYYFGMELDGGFVQTPSGKDAWDHDIIFEFTGDDDFWLYVDGELVIDLGGIHSAAPGNVNFRTGEVNVNNCTGNQAKIDNIYNTIYSMHHDDPTDGELATFRNMLYKPGGKDDPDKKKLTLKEIFAANFLSRYLAENPSASANEAYAAACAYLGGQFEAKADETYGCEDIFKDYSTHEMKIFYMERGAGASNLHMRFNLSDVKPGQVVLSKELAGSNDIDFGLVQYPYQIWYKPENSVSSENDGYVLLGNVPASGGDPGEIYVTDPKTGDPVEFASSYTVHDSSNGDITYENVYFLNPGSKMAITFPSELIGYYVVECGINKDVYTSVYGNNEELAPIDTGNVYYKDFATEKRSVKERPSVIIRNEVAETALRTLSIKKNLYSELVDIDDVVYTGERDAAKDSRAAACLLSRADDGTAFSYRLYLGNNDSDTASLPYAAMHKYRVKDENGNYCRWQNGTGFVSLGKNVFTELSDTEKLSATFETSMNGSISEIPAGYTVEVPGLIVGTKFKVEERPGEMPKGYKWLQYERTDGTYLVSEGDEPNSGTIRANSSPQMTIENKRGWGLTAEKKWSDDGYIGWHYPIYIAVYIKNGSTEEFLEGTVREITKDALSSYYYFDSMESGHTFEDYAVREVRLTNPRHDGSGNLLYDGTPEKVENGAFANVNVQQVNLSDTNVYNYEYEVTYEQGTAVGGQGAKPLDNVRTDTVTNTRSGGIYIDLGLYNDVDAQTKRVETPLSGGKFKLTLYRTTDPEKTVYTEQASYEFVTGSDGVVTSLYNFMRKTDAMDAYYILEEIQSPAGYVGLSHPVKFDIENIGGIDVVTLYDDENGDWRVLQPELDDDHLHLAHINVFNKPFGFRAVKFEAGNSSNKLGSVVFALYRQVKGGNGAYVKDYRPIAGYEHLETDDAGVIEKINETLAKGTYYLTEILPLAGFNNLIGDILFAITDLGGVELISAPDGVTLIENVDGSGTKTLDLSIPNQKTIPDLNITVHKTVSGAMGDKTRDFTFTLEVGGAAAGDTFAWSKNGTEQPPLHSGDTFTMKHDDTVVIKAAYGKTVVLTEDNGGYTTKFQKDNENAVNGNEISFRATADTAIEVTNTLSAVAETGVTHHTAAYVIMLVFAVLFLVIGNRAKRRRNTLL